MSLPLVVSDTYNIHIYINSDMVSIRQYPTVSIAVTYSELALKTLIKASGNYFRNRGTIFYMQWISL